MNKETDSTYLSSLNSKFGKTQATIKQLQEENIQLKEKIDNVIEYIINKSSLSWDGLTLYDKQIEELLELLKGEERK